MGRKPRGLGDTIENVAKATGIDKVVKFLAGEDCGCEERKKKLNTLFPYGTPRCMNELQYNQWKSFKEVQPRKEISIQEQSLIIQLLKDVLGISVTTCSNCSSAVWLKYIAMIDKVYSSY